MTLVAALAASVWVYLLVGMAVGVRPVLSPRTRDSGPGLVARCDGWLRQGDATVTVLQFVAASAGTALIGVVVVVGLTGVPSLGVLGAGLGLGAPLAVVSQRRERLVAERSAGWPDALRDLMAHLGASLSVHAGLLRLADTGPDALRPAFQRYRNLSGALDSRSALQSVRDELADPISDRAIEVLLVSFDQGPSVVIDVLEDLAVATSEDLRLNQELKTAALETALEARGAAVLPFVVLGLLCATSDDYRVFYGTPMGWMVVALGAGLSICGLVVISRLGRSAVDERTIG